MSRILHSIRAWRPAGLLAFLLAAAPLHAAMGQPTALPRGACDPYDVDCDGGVTAADAARLAAVLLGDDACAPCAGDTNGDARVDGGDIQPFIDGLFQAGPLGACCQFSGACIVTTADACPGFWLGPLSDRKSVV